MAAPKLIAKAVLGSAVCLLLYSACSRANNQLTIQQQILEASGVLQPGQQQIKSLPIGDVFSVVITAFSDQPDLLLNISDPQGNLVTSGRTSDRHLENIPSFEGAYLARLKLHDPIDGMWQIELGARSGTQYTIIVEAETSTVLDVHTDHPRYPTGSNINVVAKLFREHIPLGGGTGQGELRFGSKSIQVIDLYENDEGTFQGQFAPLNKTMRPDLLITVTNGTIQRQVLVSLMIFEPSARILSVQSEQLLDSDNDGKADQLVIAVQLDIRDTHSYSLAAHLESQKGKAITYAEYNTAIQAALGQGSETLSPGQVIISLSFSGRTIQERGIDGPYSVRLVLYDIDQAGAEVDALEYVTRPYSTNDYK